MISQDTIEKIRGEANLVEIIGESVALKRQGRNYIGLCPFHGEKTPSFSVKEEGDRYHCFGCGVSGNAFTFLMETRGLSFPEAVEDLASRYGIEVKYQGGQQAPQHSDADELYKINDLALSFFQNSLKNAPALVKAYVAERGLSVEAIKAFRIGVSPESWSALTEALQGAKIDENLMVRSGLIARNSKGKLYDRFRARLIFPIQIDSRRIVGFGGRIIPALLAPDAVKSQPKYVNSPESEIYKKSKTLFGVPQAATAIREKNEVYVVEGYMDVVGLWQVGVRNVVATCGTAITAEHVKKLAHLAKRIVILFDGDSAGRAAAAKVFPLTINSGVDVVTKFLPEEHDPDSLARAKPNEAAKLIDQIPSEPCFYPYLAQLIENYGGELGPASKGKIASELAPLLRQITNSIEQSQLIERAALRLQVPSEQLRQVVEEGGELPLPKSTQVQQEAAESSEQLPFTELPRLDQELLRAVMAQRDLSERFLCNAILCDKAHPQSVQFVMELNDVFGSSLAEETKKSAVRELLNRRGPSWLKAWKEAYEMLSDPRISLSKVFDECYRNLRKEQLKQEVMRVDRDFQNVVDPEQKLLLAQERVALTRMIRAVE